MLVEKIFMRRIHLTPNQAFITKKKRKNPLSAFTRLQGVRSIVSQLPALPVFSPAISSLINFLKLSAKIIANCGGVHSRHTTWEEVVRRLHGVLLQFFAVGLSWSFARFSQSVLQRRIYLAMHCKVYLFSPHRVCITVLKNLWLNTRFAHYITVCSRNANIYWKYKL